MIAQARRKATEKGLAIEYFAQDAAELDLPGQRFHLCVSLFDSLNNILVPERMAQAMRRVLAHLEPGGLFIFDLNTEFALKNQFFDQDNLTSNDRLRYDWTSEYFPESRLCRIQMRFWFREEDGSERAFEETHWQYAYTKTEILKMLRAAGFQELTAYQAYTFRAPAPTSDRIFYIARRPD
jgi:ubiquinone/menaquinone biosynthesis C-methylase UbiE